jgi:hypothetical protein
MADSKISALPASTTPLAGTEILPIVQSSTTKQVSVANLTAGRAISATQLTLTTGNLIVASGQGIDFSATSHPAGMTSELLNDYEEGTFTATLAGFISSPTTPVTSTSRYTKIGRQVSCQIAFKNVSTIGAASAILVQGLPFTAGDDSVGVAQQSGMSTTNIPVALLFSGTTQIEIFAANAFTNLSFSAGVGQYLFVNITYTV